MTKQEKNEAIAKILGFEKYGIKVNVSKRIQRDERTNA
jgi:hypothetical protein